MSDLVKSVIGAPAGTILMLAGIGFLAIAVVGNVSGRIEPGRTGRIGSAVLGIVCLALGLFVQWPLTLQRDMHQDQPVAGAPLGPKASDPATSDRVAPASTPGAASPGGTPAGSSDILLSTRPQTAAPARPAESAPVTEKTIHGDWGVQIINVSRKGEYKERYYQERKGINPQSPDQDLVILDIRLWNVTANKLQFNFKAGNTGLIDILSHSYVPLDIDAEIPAGKCCNYLSAYVLPNTILDAAMVFSVPKERGITEFILSISSSYVDPGSDLRIPMPKLQ